MPVGHAGDCDAVGDTVSVALGEPVSEGVATVPVAVGELVGAGVCDGRMNSTNQLCATTPGDSASSRDEEVARVTKPAGAPFVLAAP